MLEFENKMLKFDIFDLNLTSDTLLKNECRQILSIMTNFESLMCIQTDIEAITLYHFHCSQPLLHKRTRFMRFRKWCGPDLWKDRAKRWLQYPTIHPRTMLGSVQELPWCNWMWSWGNYSQYWNWRPWRVESKMLCSYKQRNIWKWREWKILLGVFQLWYR